jgi:glycerate-2-kinase
MTAPASLDSPSALLADLYWAAVAAAAPGPALSTALASQTSESKRSLHLLALGKAALPMAAAAVDTLRARGQEPAGGLLVLPEPATAPHPSLVVAVGDHPEPGPGSLRAAQLLQEAVAQVRPEDEVWVLLSGGTTSLIGAPIEGVDPAQLTQLYRLLLGSGLDITAMNRIRKRFSRWGAGRLATALAPARVKNFTISDVIGDDLASIGSGPCVPDTSTAAEVRAMLTSANLWEKIPEPLRAYLTAVQHGGVPETPKPDHPAFATTTAIVIASNRLALEAACRRARSLGLIATLKSTELAGEASVAGERIATILSLDDGETGRPAQDSGLNKDAVLVWGGETTVTLGPDPGAGGRCQELALAAARTLGDGGQGRRAVTILAAGTDGRDGPTDAAGAIVDATTWSRIQAAGRNPQQDLSAHRSHQSLEAADALFKTGMTGTNVMDVVLGLVRGKT